MRRSPRKPKFKIQLANKGSLRRLAILFAVFFAFTFWAWLSCFWMPAKTFAGKLPPLQPEEIALQNLLKKDLQKLASEIGPRNFGEYKNLNLAKSFLSDSLTQSGYQVKQQEYKVKKDAYYNLEVEKRGTEKPDEVIIIGGHYDSAFTSPGANDNGTGAVATLELARLFADKSPKRTIRFVEFTNEEPPFFWTDDMGSLVYAKQLADRQEKVVAMLSLETLGYFDETAGSQKYLFPMNLLYPNKGNFVAFIGNFNSGKLVRDSIASFRHQAQVPSEGAVLPGWVAGVGWSDQWSFWQQGYPGIMVTDTAHYRYPHYHTIEDTVDKINFEQLTRTVVGLSKVVSDLAG